MSVDECEHGVKGRICNDSTRKAWHSLSKSRRETGWRVRVIHCRSDGG